MPHPRLISTDKRRDLQQVSPHPHHSLTFYPAYCNRASPTWFTWVKLTAYDVYNVLRPRDGYKSVPHRDHTVFHNGQHPAPLTLYYLNHPIQYIQLVGIVVAIEPYYERVHLFILDDSSGATLAIVTRKPESLTRQQPETSTDPRNGITKKPSNANPTEAEAEAMNLWTRVQRLDIGFTIRAKGTLTTFRSTLQLSLLRLDILPPSPHPTTTTVTETQLIASRTAFLNTTLSQPWTVSPAQQNQLLREAQGEAEAENERTKRRRKREAMKVERERRHEKVIAKQWEEEETRRAREAELAREAGGNLRSRR